MLGGNPCTAGENVLKTFDGHRGNFMTLHPELSYPFASPSQPPAQSQPTAVSVSSETDKRTGKDNEDAKYESLVKLSARHSLKVMASVLEPKPKGPLPIGQRSLQLQAGNCYDQLSGLNQD